MKTALSNCFYFLNWLSISILLGITTHSHAQSVQHFSGCDSVIVELQRGGATYNWSNGDTTSSQTFFQSDTVFVDITVAGNTSRSSIIVWVFSLPTDPILGDTSICLGEPLKLGVSPGLGTTHWYNDSLGSKLLATGDSLFLTASQSKTYYAQRINGFSPTKAGLDTLKTQGGSQSTYYKIDRRSLVFNATSDFFLSYVDIYVDDTTSGTVVLEGPNNNILDSLDVYLTQIGANEVALDFFVPQGSGYKLTFRNRVGGGLYIEIPVGFPLTSGPVSINGGVPYFVQYVYFYHWQINTSQNCRSNLIPAKVTVLPVPEVDLGADTILCDQDSFLLDASFPAATYLWNDGDTQARKKITATDTLEVELSLGTCKVSDEIRVYLLETPAAPAISDTSICGPQQIRLFDPNKAHAGANIVWFDAASGGNIIGSGDTLDVFVSQNRTIYSQAVTGFSPSTAGLDTIGTQGGINSKYYNLDNRGLVFDALKSFYLSTLDIYVDGSTSGTVTLSTSSGVILGSKDVQLPVAGKNTVRVNFFVPKGIGYFITFKNRVGGGLYIEFPVTFPVVSGNVSIKGGFPFNQYPFFYHWKINQEHNCQSPRVPINVNVLPSPSVNLGIDTVVCDNDSLFLDASFGGASYLWSTGDTIPAIYVKTSDTFRVELAIGNCKTSDEVVVFAFPTPPDPIVLDTSLCGKGNITLRTQSNSPIFWYDQMSGGNLLAKGDTFRTYVLDTTSFYVQAINGLRPSRAGLLAPQNTGTSAYHALSERSLQFDANKSLYLTSVTLYANDTLTGRIVLENASLQEIASKSVRLTNIGANEVKLNFYIPQGIDYRLTFRDLKGGSLFFQIPVGYPLSSEFVTIKRGVPFFTQYPYFFNWKINEGLACVSNKVPNTVSVILPDKMVDYVFSCDSIQVGSNLAQAGHLWNTGDTSQFITVNQSGEYTVTLDDGANCMVNDTIEVEIPREVGLAEDGIICGMELTTNYQKPSRFLWSTGDTTATLQLSQTGTYWVDIIEKKGNCFRTDTIVVSGFENFPMVSLGGDVSACDSITLDAGNPGFSYLWSLGDSTQKLTVFSTGLYWVAVTNNAGCTAKDTINATISRAPIARFFPTVFGYDVSINNLSTLSTTFMWNFGDGTQKQGVNPNHTYLDTGMFTITLIVVNSCGSDTFSSVVHIVDPTAIPEPFSGQITLFPNPANRHIFLKIKDRNFQEIQLQLLELNGRTIMEKELNSVSGSSLIRIELPDTPTGLYFLRLRADKQEFYYKLYIR